MGRTKSSCLRLGVHYHIEVFRSGAVCWVPYYFGIWVDALASRFRKVYLIAHCTDGELPADYDFELDPAKVEVLDLGPKPHLLKRVFSRGRTSRQMAAWADRMDMLLCRYPTPLAHYLALPIAPERRAYFLIGSPYKKTLASTADRAFASPAYIKKRLWLAYWLMEYYWFQWMARRGVVLIYGEHIRGEYGFLDRMHYVPSTIVEKNHVRRRIPGSAGGTGGRILTVARFGEEKGLEVLIDVAKFLKEQGDDFCMTIAGATSGPLFRHFNERVVGEGLADRVSFPGYVKYPGVYDLMDDHDIFVISHPASLVGQPRSLWQALARGMAVVATQSVAASDLRHGEHIYYSGHEAEDIGAGIHAVLSSPPLQERLRQGAYEAVQSKTVEAAVGRTAEILAENYRINEQR